MARRHWAKAENFYLTDELLSQIEDNESYKQAFGWAKGTTVSVPTGGKKAIKHCKTLAKVVLIDDRSKQWSNHDEETLAEVVRNRINVLKSTYKRYWDDFGQTGQGLVTENRMEEVGQGTKIGNLWVKKIQKNFPWFMRLHEYLSKSPVMDYSAVGHSGSVMDLDVLNVRNGQSASKDTSIAPESEDEDAVFDSASQKWDLEENESSSSSDIEIVQDDDAMAVGPDLGELEAAASEDNDSDYAPTRVESKLKMDLSKAEDKAMKAAPPMTSVMTSTTQPRRSNATMADKINEAVSKAATANVQTSLNEQQARTERERLHQKASLKAKELELQARVAERSLTGWDLSSMLGKGDSFSELSDFSLSGPSSFDEADIAGDALGMGDPGNTGLTDLADLDPMPEMEARGLHEMNFILDT
ncbi:hypothetical protein M422DRAFT_42001 [Sphaerobolus stellatus SS14]|nr:hypothetical protein M422DRAFT_42001 [Sphaerobolus stellatus SS14]